MGAGVPGAIPYCLCKLKSFVRIFSSFKLLCEQVQMAFMNWANWNVLLPPAETEVLKNEQLRFVLYL